MVVQKTPRLRAEIYTEGSDTHPNRAKFNSELQLFDALIAIAAQGATAERPVPGIDRRLFWDTTAKRLFWDDGTAWNEITTNGGGGAGGQLTPGTAGVEGISERSARADHTHLLAMATAAMDGAMSKTDKAKLDGASSIATPGSFVLLDSNGRTQVASPSANADVANKSYVDTAIGTRAPSSHTHTPTQITGTLAPDQLPTATTTVQGAMPAADRKTLSDATYQADPNTLAKRGSSGQIYVGTPTNSEAATTKAYVDTQIAGRSPSSHTHSWSQISGKPTAFTPSSHTHDGGQITGTISPARINNATTSADGLMSAADKRAINASATESYVNNQVAKLPNAFASGVINVGELAVNQTRNLTINLPAGRFSGAPRMFYQSSHTRITTGDGSTSATSASLTVGNYTNTTTGGSSTLTWMAIQ